MTIETLLLDDKGKKMKAIDVFSSAINYLKNQMIKQCEKRFKHIDIMDSDVTWVLTVPAIWNDSSKQFMREAAKKVLFSFYFIMHSFTVIRDVIYSRVEFSNLD